jgi:hypothetical protein
MLETNVEKYAYFIGMPMHGLNFVLDFKAFFFGKINN